MLHRISGIPLTTVILALLVLSLPARAATITTVIGGDSGVQFPAEFNPRDMATDGRALYFLADAGVVRFNLGSEAPWEVEGQPVSYLGTKQGPRKIAVTRDGKVFVMGFWCTYDNSPWEWPEFIHEYLTDGSPVKIAGTGCANPELPPGIAPDGPVDPLELFPIPSPRRLRVDTRRRIYFTERPEGVDYDLRLRVWGREAGTLQTLLYGRGEIIGVDGIGTYQIDRFGRLVVSVRVSYDKGKTYEMWRVEKDGTKTVILSREEGLVPEYLYLAPDGSSIFVDLPTNRIFRLADNQPLEHLAGTGKQGTGGDGDGGDPLFANLSEVSNLVVTDDYTVFFTTADTGSASGKRVRAITGLKPVSVSEPAQSLPSGITLSPPSPNPFNGRVSITMTVDILTEGSVSIVSLSGQIVRVLRSGMLTQGRHQLIWDGTDSEGQPAASGVYLLRVASSSQQVTRKIVFVR